MNLRYLFVFAMFFVYFVSFGFGAIESVEYYKQKYGLSDEFIQGVQDIANKYGVRADALLDIIEFETDSSFSPSKLNYADGNAIGLIQFRKSTLTDINKNYGTNYNFNSLGKMSREDQLEVVDKYFDMWENKYGKDMKSDIDLAMLVFQPAKIGRDPSTVLFSEGSNAYKINKGVDLNGDGQITVGEYANAAYTKGDSKNKKDANFALILMDHEMAYSGIDYRTASTACDGIADTGLQIGCIGDDFNNIVDKSIDEGNYEYLLKIQKEYKSKGDLTAESYLRAVDKISELNDEIEQLEASGSTSDELKELRKQRDGLMQFVSNIDDTVELIFAAANDEQREDIATALSGTCNPSIWNAWCVFKKKVDLRDEVTNRVNDAVKDATNKCKADSDCSAGEYNKLLNAELEKLIAIQCSAEDLECQELKELLEEQIELNSAVDTNYGFDIISAIVRPDKASIDAAKFFGFEADYSNIPAFLRESIPSYLCMSKIEGYVDKEINTAGGVTKYGCDSQFEQEFDYSVSPPALKSDGSPNCIAVLGDIRAQKTQLTPNGKVDITYSAYIKAPGFKVNYLVAVTYIQGGDKKKVALTELNELSNKSSDKIYDHATIPINQTEGELDEGSFVIGLLAVDESNNPYLTLTAPVVTISSGDSYYDNTAGYSNSGGNSAASSNENQITTNDMLDLI